MAGDFVVFPENASALDVFLTCATQWEWFVGERLFLRGLNYAGCEAGLRLADITMTPELFGDLQAMETAAIKAFNG